MRALDVASFGYAEILQAKQRKHCKTPYSSDSTPKLKTNMVKPRNDDSISSKVIRTQTEQFLELFSRTLNFIFLRLKDVKISLYIIVLIACGCFAQSHLKGLNKLFLHLMRALCFCIVIRCYFVFFHVYYKCIIKLFFSRNLKLISTC